MNEFNKENFLSWFNAQPADREFNYHSHADCLFASFLKEKLGYEGVSCGGTSFEFVKNGVCSGMFFPNWADMLSHTVGEISNLRFGLFSIEQIRHLVNDAMLID